MKFAFITLAAVVVLWSARADGDNADIYAGIPDDSPFSKQDDDYSPLFPQSSYTLPRMRGSFPWTRDRKPTKAAQQGGDRMTETMFRELEEMLERRRQQIKVDAVRNIQYLGPHLQILDDPRPYAAEEQEGDAESDNDAEGDFSFPADDFVLDNSDVSQAEQAYRNRYPYARLNPWEEADQYQNQARAHAAHEQESHEEHASHKATDDALPVAPAGSGLFKDVEFVKDPAEFGYPPTDPRYFEESTRQEIVIGSKIDRVKDESDAEGPAGTEGKTNKNAYGSLDSAAAATYTNADPDAIAAHLQPADDYGFLTDDDEQASEQKDYVKSLLTDMDINVKHRNDLGSGRPNDKDFLRDDEDVEVVAVRTQRADSDSTGIYILAIIAGVSAAALVTLITLVITWLNLQKHVKNASDAEYPAYGVTGPNKEVSPSGDRRLAQSAQMYHYQHQKQQIIAMERAAATDRHGSISEADSDEENEEGDYTVYECPGLAPTGEMEVKNPMFQDDPTPAQTPQQKQSEGATAKK